MPELRRAPTWPWQTVDVTADFRIVLRRAQRDHIEFGLISHVAFESLRRLAAIAGRPAAAIDFAQDVFRRDRTVLDFDVIEHLLSKSELTGKQIHRVIVVLAFENRIDDLLTPLERAVGSGA